MKYSELVKMTVTGPGRFVDDIQRSIYRDFDMAVVINTASMLAGMRPAVWLRFHLRNLIEYESGGR